MTVPSGVTRQRPEFSTPFTEFADMPAQWGFVGMRVLAPIDVPTQTGDLYVEPIEEELQDGELERNADGSYNRMTDKFEDREYKTKELGIEARLPDRLLSAYRDLPSAEAATVRRLNRRIMRSIEKRLADKLTDTSGTFTGDLTADVGDSGFGGAWTDHANATPMTDINLLLSQFHDNSGQIADTMVLPYKRLLDLVNSSEIRDTIKYWGGDDPKPGNLLKKVDILAAAFGIQRILVAGAIRNTADKGQDVSLSSIWPETKVGIYKTAPAGSDMDNPCIGRLATWGGDQGSVGMGEEPELQVESYREDQTRSEVFRSRAELDYKNVIWYDKLGLVYTGVSA